MPDEPNNSVDEGLKSWAQKRREEAGPPFEMHPATRQLLQSEVARTYPPHETTRKAGANWLHILWPRLATAGAVAAVLFVVIVQTRPPKEEAAFQIAKREELPGALDAKRFNAGESRPAMASDDRKNTAAAFPDLARSESAPRDQTTIEFKSVPLSLTSGESTSKAKAIDEKERQEGAALESRRPADEFGERGQLAKAATPAPVVSPPPEPVRARGLEEAGRSANQTLAGADRARRLDVPQSPARLPAATAPEPARAGRGGGGGGRTVNAPAPPTTISPALGTSPASLAMREGDATASRFAAPGQDGTAGKDQTAQRYGSAVDTAGSGQITQRFTQVPRYRRNFNSPPTPDVLNSFQLEQSGLRLRIVDADGSIYEGNVSTAESDASQRGALPAAQASNALRTVAQQPAPQTGTPGQPIDAAAAPGAAISFLVSGTNRTLGQSVVFQGNLLMPVVQAAPSGNDRNVSLRQQTSSRSQFLPGNQTQSSSPQIQGQATIGGASRFEINAEPVVP